MDHNLSETRVRTLARAVTYRAMAMIASYLMVGLGQALAVELSKTVIYYVLERYWLRINWQVTNGVESQFRIITRAITYRTVATVAVSYWVGIDLALILALIHTVLFYMNDMAWQKIPWGKNCAAS